MSILQPKLFEVPRIISGEFIPYKDCVKENITLREFAPVDFGNDYSLKIRIKAFVLMDKEGNEYDRGPCISLQLFHGWRFLKALALPSGREHEVLDRLNQATTYITNLSMV